MTEQEQFELAAKAVGIVGEWELDPAFITERWRFVIPYDNQGMTTGIEWNPLRDNSDSFRLETALELEFEWLDGFGGIVGFINCGTSEFFLQKELKDIRKEHSPIGTSIARSRNPRPLGREGCQFESIGE